LSEKSDSAPSFEDPEAVEPADMVVLHRVVCGYPDYERLLGAAADHARRALVFSYPPRNAPSRAFYGSSPGRTPRPPGPVEVAE
jgi:hypothetical protein